MLQNINIYYYGTLLLNFSIAKILWENCKQVFVMLVTWRDTEGNTPIHTASQNGHKDLVELFLQTFQDDEVCSIVSK